MKIRFLADANLDRQIVEGVCRRERAIDFLSAEETGLHGKSDLQVLEISRTCQRVLATHDKKTMPAAFGKFLLGQHSPGVLIVPPQMGIGQAVEGLFLVWSLDEQEDWINRIMYLPTQD